MGIVPRKVGTFPIKVENVGKSPNFGDKTVILQFSMEIHKVDNVNRVYIMLMVQYILKRI